MIYIKEFWWNIKWYLLYFLFTAIEILKLVGCFAIQQVYGGGISTTDLVNSIYNFCELVSGKTLFPYQEQFSKRIIRSVIENDGAEITALFARQSGKTEAVSCTVCGLMIILPRLANMPMFTLDKRLEIFKDGFWVGIFAPGQRQAQITFNRMKARLQSKTAIAVLNEPEFNLGFSTSNGQTVALTNGSFATAISASDGSSIEGESFKFIICEECQDISNSKIRKSIHPMGAAYNATMCKIGTATSYRGDFYEAIQRNKREFNSRETKIRNHFEYDWKVAAKYNIRYAKYVEGEKRKLGENSDDFRMSYGLEWIIERGMFIEINKFLLNCGDLDLDRVTYDHQAVHVVGIDVGGSSAKKTADSTLITVVEVDWSNPVVFETRTDPETNDEYVFKAYNTYIKDWLELQIPDYEQQYAEIVSYLKNFKIVRCVCDATREASMAHRLRANMPFEVIPFIYSTKSKSELYKHLEREINTGRARVPIGASTVETREFNQFIDQLEDLQKNYNGSYLVVSHPDISGYHDDYPDSWALAVWGCMTEGVLNDTETRNKKDVLNQDSSVNIQIKARNKHTAKRR